MPDTQHSKFTSTLDTYLQRQKDMEKSGQSDYTKLTLNTVIFKSTSDTVKYLTPTLDTDPPFKGRRSLAGDLMCQVHTVGPSGTQYGPGFFIKMDQYTSLSVCLSMTGPKFRLDRNYYMYYTPYCRSSRTICIQATTPSTVLNPRTLTLGPKRIMFLLSVRHII